jgi:hypothetical protein
MTPQKLGYRGRTAIQEDRMLTGGKPMIKVLLGPVLLFAAAGLADV